MEALHNTHDLRLPAWGPYTKAYMGISHIPDVRSGLRFDLSVFPGFYRGRIDIPNVKWESGYHPWEAAPDLSYFCHRHELVWKDQVYVDVSFSSVDACASLVRCECVNRTELPQTLALHYMASLHFPPLRPNSNEALHPGRPVLPDGALWIDALAYADLAYATPRPTDNLVPDGLYRGEIRDHALVGGTGVGRGFGQEAGDRLQYVVQVSHAFADAVLGIRCRLVEGSTVRLRLSGLAEAIVSVPGTGSLALVRVPVGAVSPGAHPLKIAAEGGASLEIDGFVLCESGDWDQIAFETVECNGEARLIPGPLPNTLRLAYEPLPGLEYGLAWKFEPFQVRQFYGDELDRLMRYTVHNHVSSVIRDAWAPVEPHNHFTNVFLRPIALAPGERRVVHGVVCCGSPEEVDRRLAGASLDAEVCEAIWKKARSKVVDLGGNPAGGGYRFSQERMAATTLTNVVYPIYLRGTYIRHNTPGRWWDSLYTWDSGFMGLGLLELDAGRAIDCLNAYMTEPGDPHAAFIHHGSPVPVQFYLFLDLWNRGPDRRLLEYFYPRLKQYYKFLSGSKGSSTTRVQRSNLLKTWDYFYNSGGWDDYPPQVHVHRHGLTGRVAPAVTTAHCVRAAKILRMMALALGEGRDVQGYERDIRLFADALQSFAWDEEAGYFSYVVHDEGGRAVGFLRHESGENLNRGLDGVSPLIAGVCTSEQEQRLFAHLRDPRRHWTDVGLSTVDMSAPYFRIDGYWNGAVWMPHQWFVWKTCLDLNQPAFAWQIARTALDVWQREVDASYNCYEHFPLATGRGAGWHHFAGLSTPVLCWYGAYYRPGRLTTGFDVWVDAVDVSDDHRSLQARLRTYGRAGRTLQAIAGMAPGEEYAASWNGEPCQIQRLHPGVFYVELPCAAQGVLEIIPL